VHEKFARADPRAPNAVLVRRSVKLIAGQHALKDERMPIDR
jgi:hypothetical protein